VEGADFEVASYEGNVHAGTATAVVRGKGAFSGMKEVAFEVAPADIASVDAAPIPAQTYTGSALTPAPALAFNGRALAEGADYEVASYSGNVHAGAAAAPVRGRGDFSGELEVPFEVAPADISAAHAEDIPARAYTGSAIEPAPELAFAGKALASGVDYEVSWRDNVEPGVAKAVVTGKGAFKGVRTLLFSIARADIASADAAPIPAQTYTGSALTPVPELAFNGEALAEGADFEVVAYGGNAGPGAATVTVRGRGRFSGELEIPFEVAPAGKSGIRAASAARLG
jgi:hypothetical protein